MEINELINYIKILKRKLKEKEIIIEALVDKLSNIENKDRSMDVSLSSIEMPPSSGGINNNLLDSIAYKMSENKIEEKVDDSVLTKGNKLVINPVVQPSKEITELINYVIKAEDPPQFKPNASVLEFMEYCTLLGSPGIFDSSKVSLSKNLKTYIRNNKKGILKAVMERINDYKLLDIYNILSIVSYECGYVDKLIIIHDFFIFIKKTEYIIFLVYSILRNDCFRNDILGSTIKKMIEHQLSLEEIGNDKLSLAINHIIDNLKLAPQKHDLEELVEDIFKEVAIFRDGEITNEAMGRALSIKLLCDYLDWDWTYNTFIVEKSKLSNNSEFFIFILGLLGLNAWVNFGFIESVSVIFNKMEEIMKSNNNNIQIRIIAYLFVKLYKPNKAEEWVIKNEESVKEIIEIDKLKEMIVY
ncbi:hypothetical protein TCON_0706 [Astathelohania contejeani]|uniref:Uncharacterized protein n=1 Tax=Astathelohania contejeani TaxID=164912 RepID=A0ABQ7I0V0_9MICR|nr:hypothetical protein TCON_0706 [Thelohania contejeani]